MEQQKKQIPFTTFDGTVFSGRPRGEASRQKINLDALDKESTIIEFIFPLNMVTMTSSFFLGMFDKSIEYFMDKNKFFKKYIFKNLPPSIYSQMDEWYESAMAKINRKNLFK